MDFDSLEGLSIDAMGSVLLKNLASMDGGINLARKGRKLEDFLMSNGANGANLEVSLGRKIKLSCFLSSHYPFI
jgi:hypothetical protein